MPDLRYLPDGASAEFDDRGMWQHDDHDIVSRGCNQEDTEMTHVYSDDVYDRAVSKEQLETRLELNRKYQSTDFQSWLLERLPLREGQTVLDVGCGTGAQTIPFLDKVGARGHICALDISEDSIQILRQKAGPNRNLTAVASDMQYLESVIRQSFQIKEYDIAHSSYALYYSPERIKVLDAMRAHLKPQGTLAIFTPNTPHGMVEAAKQVSPIPPEVEESLGFGPSILESYFRGHFWDVTVHFFHNVVSIPSLDEVLRFYRSTTYYYADRESEFANLISARIRKAGAFTFEKNGYLILGKRQL
jgi:ubiquinone/menaquinone biosynthesis C-methylase UbiE